MGTIILVILAISLIGVFVWSAAQPPPETLLTLQRKARKERAQEESEEKEAGEPDAAHEA